MSLATRIESLVIRVAQEFNDVRATAGNLASLSTTDKSSLVAAINELKAAVLSATADALVLDLGAGNADALRPLRDGGSQRGADVRAIVICTGPANALVAWHGDADEVLTRPFAATALESAIADSLRRPDDDRRARRAQQVAALSD